MLMVAFVHIVMLLKYNNATYDVIIDDTVPKGYFVTDLLSHFCEVDILCKTYTNWKTESCV